MRRRIQEEGYYLRNHGVWKMVYEDFVKSKELEPKNKEINEEIARLEQALCQVLKFEEAQIVQDSRTQLKEHTYRHIILSLRSST